MKKVISLIICVVLAVGLFASCMGGDDKTNDNNSDKLRIVTTVFSTAQDIVKISTCDLFIYAGFAPKRDEDGDITGVRYQFETDSSGLKTQASITPPEFIK